MGVTSLSSAVFCHFSSSQNRSTVADKHHVYTASADCHERKLSGTKAVVGVSTSQEAQCLTAFSQFVKSSFVCASESLILTPTFQECFKTRLVCVLSASNFILHRDERGMHLLPLLFQTNLTFFNCWKNLIKCMLRVQFSPYRNA